MDKEQVLEILKQINWDTPYTPEQLYQVFTGEVDAVGGVDKKWIYRKLLNGYNWYKVKKIVPESEWPQLLSDEVIRTLFPRHLRYQYHDARKLLYPTFVSPAG
jgi:hypothetical protein